MEGKNNPQIVYYFHAGSENHGCEAIVRSTTDLLSVKPFLFSDNPAGDKAYGIEKVVDLQQPPVVNYSFFEKLKIKITNSDELAYFLRAKHEAKAFTTGSVALSIGGDNYCYGDTYNWHLAGLNESLHKKNVKTVLWGCSIEPESVTEKMEKDFARYDLIVARESISYEFLKRINSKTIYACDPAFSLKEEQLPLPKGFKEGKTVGINISPLIQKSERIEGITFKNYKNLVDFILERTDYNIALIPHVVQQGNDDREPLRKLYEGIADKSRACLIDDCNCMQLKGYISRCSLFVGARTHATIAAYSTCVPTLVVGYSTKAKGIARDLFRDEENYVLPVQKLNESTQMKDTFIWLNEQRTAIRNHLKKVIPEYKRSINEAVKKVREL